MVQEFDVHCNGLSETLSKVQSEAHPASDDGSLLSETHEACHLSESTEEERKQHPANRQKMRRRHDSNGDDKNKSLVDPRKYKTKLCRNWKATGTCPYEHTCCYAHGEVETRTMQQNNNVLSSLGYFSGIMLLAMKEDKAGGKGGAKQGKKPQPKNVAALSLKRPEVPTKAEIQANLAVQPNTPTVHSPYCLPEGTGFGSDSAPGSPLDFSDAPMPSYSYRMEAAYPPKSPSFGPVFGPYPDPMGHYEAAEYCIPMPGPYSPYHPASPLGSPLAFPPCYPTFKDHMAYQGYPADSVYPEQQLDAHQAAMEKHPAIRNLQSGELSHKQLQKVLHDIMYSNGNKQRRTKKKQECGQE